MGRAAAEVIIGALLGIALLFVVARLIGGAEPDETGAPAPQAATTPAPATPGVAVDPAVVQPAPAVDPAVVQPAPALPTPGAAVDPAGVQPATALEPTAAIAPEVSTIETVTAAADATLVAIPRTPGPTAFGSNLSLGVPVQAGACPATHPVKGGIDPRHGKLYHQPGQLGYDVAQPRECFATAAEAEGAGYRAAQR